MGYSRSCPRTQAAPTRHVFDLTPRSDSRPHQPFSLPKHRANTEPPGSGSARAHHKVKLVPHRAFLLSGSPLLVPAVSLLPRAAAIRDSTPLNHFSVPSPSLFALPPAAAEKTLASSQSVQPALRRCSLLHSKSAASCCRNPRQHAGSTLLSAPPELFSLCLSQQTRRQWLPASPSGGSPPPLLSPVQHLCCPVLLRSATATLAASLKSQATKMRCNGSTTLRLVEQKQWKHKRTAVRASPGLLQHRKTIPFAT